jgi:hypothetical protein
MLLCLEVDFKKKKVFVLYLRFLNSFVPSISVFMLVF